MGDQPMTDGRDASRTGFNAALWRIAPTHAVHVLLPCDDGDHVLAEIGPKNVARLPSMRIPTSGNKYYSWDVLERKVEEAFPFPVCLVKRMCNYQEDDIENPGCKVLQDIWIVHAAGEFPPIKEPLKWVHEDDVSSYEWPNAMRGFVAGHVRPEVENLFSDVQTPFEMRAKPWEALGFYKELTSWSHRVLRRRKMVMEGRIKLLHGTGEDRRLFTCAARAQDDEHVDGAAGGSEVIFIKCTLPVAREVERTVAVARVFGDVVPEILGFDSERGVLMQRNAGKVTDEGLDREALIGTILRMQRVSLKHIPELEANGLPVMDSEWLESKVEPILNHGIFEELFAFMGECKRDCDDKRETIKSLRSKTGEFRKMCREFSKLGLPNTIVHGDCHAGNIGSSTRTGVGKKYLLFDWAQTHIGSPLVDFDNIFPGRDFKKNKKDWESGVRQVCEEWKELAGLTYADVIKAIDDMGSLQLFFEVYKLEEQFDICTTRAKEDANFHLELEEHQARIFCSLETLLQILSDVNQYI